MSAVGSSVVEQSGFTGIPLPQVNGRSPEATIRTRNSFCSGPVRVSVCQTLPAADNTSNSPYSADPAVSGTATNRASTGFEGMFFSSITRNVA